MSGDWFQANIATLKEIDPDLAQRVETYEPTGRHKLATVDNAPNLVYEDGTYMYDGEPMVIAKRELERIELDTCKIAVVLGVGMGFELAFFVADYADKTDVQKIIIVEQEFEIFYLSLYTFDYATVCKTFALKFAIGIPKEQLFAEYYALHKANQDLITFIKAVRPVYRAANIARSKDYYYHAWKVWAEAAVFRLDEFGNSVEDSMLGVENLLLNMDEMLNCPGINKLYNKFKGRPGIVASTGPSLNKNKHLLKGLEDKVIIACPDASGRVLIDAGIKPHLITSMERVPELVEVTESFTADDTDRSYLTTLPIINRTMMTNYPGEKIMVLPNHDHFKWLGLDRGIMEIKQSAGNMAFKILTLLGCDPIILVGQDMAYGADGKSHAKGAALGEDQYVDVKLPTFEVPGNDGKPVKTHKVWNNIRLAYELSLKDWEGTCINATEGGAKILGAEVMTLKEAIDKHINNKPADTYLPSPLTVIRDALSEFKPSDHERDQVHELMDQTIADMQDIIKACNEAKDWIDGLGRELDSPKMTPERAQELRGELIQWRIKAHGEQRTFQLYFMHIVQSYYMRWNVENVVLERTGTIAAYQQYMKNHRTWFERVAEIAKRSIEPIQHYRGGTDG